MQTALQPWCRRSLQAIRANPRTCTQFSPVPAQLPLANSADRGPRRTRALWRPPEPRTREPENHRTEEPANREPVNREPVNREPVNREPVNREPANPRTLEPGNLRGRAVTNGAHSVV